MPAMRLRPATSTDFPAMHRVRMAVRENVLSDPAAITEDDYLDMIRHRGRGWVVEEGSEIVAFAIADHSRRNIWALFVAPGHERRGHGKLLHDTMMAWLFAQGEDTVWLGTEPGTRAERFYRAAGWREVGRLPNGEIRFEREARVRPAQVERCLSPQHPGWRELRAQLWPDCPEGEHREEMAAMFRKPTQFAAFVARAGDGSALGFAEGALRNDYVDGTTSSPVAFLEGIFVVPAARRRGIARQLVESVARWGRELGCREFASNALADDAESHGFHRAAGFAETERVVFFLRKLR
jgi:aminoglycoside 6'-N-acetyltransferase I